MRPSLESIAVAAATTALVLAPSQGRPDTPAAAVTLQHARIAGAGVDPEPGGALGRVTARPAGARGSVVVAVVDTGVELSHPALRNRLWTNASEIAGNGRDDDRNGIADDVHGADFVAGSGSPVDDVGHGTHVAGIVAGSETARIMPLKVTSGPWVSFQAVAAAIRYAADHGARIVNLSWESRARDQGVEDAIGYALERDVLVVAAAGNGRADNDLFPDYPASYPGAAILSVAATCDEASLAPFSNYGKLGVDLAAPGCAIESAYRGGLARQTGTSMAAAAVSRAAATLSTARPGATARDLQRALLDGSRRLDRLDAAVLAGGVLDEPGALSALAAPPDREPPPPFAQLSPPRRFSAVRSPTTYYQEITFSWRPSSDRSLSGYRLELDGTPVRGSGARATSVTMRVAPGDHSWSVVAFDRAGNERVARGD